MHTGFVMRNALSQRPTAARAEISISRADRRRTPPARAALLAAVLASALGGCGVDFSDARSHVPLPKTALLTRQPPPNCEYRTANLDTSSKREPGTLTAADTDPDRVARAKLDYERQCYRHAELIARSRLRDLQDAVQVTAKAVKRGDSVNPTP
jgi:hypothetical protein